MRVSRFCVMLLLIVSMIFLLFGSVYADDSRLIELELCPPEGKSEFAKSEIPDLDSRLKVYRYTSFDGVNSSSPLYGAIKELNLWAVAKRATSSTKYRQVQLWFVLLKPVPGVDINKQSYWENKAWYQVVHGVDGDLTNPYKFRFNTMALANWQPSSSTVESGNVLIIPRETIITAIREVLGADFDTTGVVLGIGANIQIISEDSSGNITVLRTMDTLSSVESVVAGYGFSSESIEHMKQRFQMAPLDGSFNLYLNLYEYDTSPLRRIPKGDCEVKISPESNEYEEYEDDNPNAVAKYLYRYINNPRIELEALSNEYWGFVKWGYTQEDSIVEKTDSKLNFEIFSDSHKKRNIIVNAYYKKLGGADFYPTPGVSSTWQSSYASDSGVKVNGIAGETVSFTMRVYNDSGRPEDKTDLKVYWWGMEGSPLDYKETNILKGGEFQTFTFSNIVVPPNGSENRLVFKVNTDGNNPVDESNKTNNILVIRVEENAATTATGNYSIPEWRLSKYWDEIVPASDVVSARSWYSPPYASCCGPWLSPSGVANYGLVSVSGLPIWVRTLQKLAPSENLNRSITLGNMRSGVDVRVYGNLLAIKTNDEIDNIRTSNWVTGNANLSSYNIGGTNKGAETARSIALTKSCVFDYNIHNNQMYSYTYSTGSCGWDEYGSWSCSLYTITMTELNSPASYNIEFNFNRHKPTVTTAVNIPDKEEIKNGEAGVSAQSGDILKVNPEVFMIYSQHANNSNLGAFTAGDILREMKPVSYHTLRFIADIKPSVVSLGSVTDVRAKTLVNSIASGKPVTLKGASSNISFVPNGKIVISSYLLDVKDTALKNAWGNSAYDTSKASEDFMKKFATRNTDGTWSLTGKAIQQLKIKNTLYGKNTSNVAFKNTSNTVKEHSIVIRGGKVVSGVPAGCPADIFERLGLLPGETNSVLSVFQRGKGAIPDELVFKTLAKTARNGQDITSGWYNEDTTTLIIREYSSVFELPLVFYSDKIPMNVPGLETPVNKNMFFSKGEPGYTTLRFSIATTGGSLNPYNNSGGSLEVYMQFDSSETNNPFGVFSKDFIVPNVSILDTTF